MKRTESIRIVVHCPKTKDGQAELSYRTAMVHANHINSQIQQLKCSGQQKVALINTMIHTAESLAKGQK